MTEVASKKTSRTFRFDEMASIVNDRIDNPSEANVNYYIGLEHLDSDSLTIRRWGSPTDVEATKLRFRAGDIIFGRRRVYQRKLGVAHFDGICSAHAMVLRAKPEVVMPDFLPFFMQSDRFMERAKEISVGSLSPTINWKTLAKEQFALPTREEQVRTAKSLAAIDTTIDSLFQLKQCCARLEQSLLDDIFDPMRSQEARASSTTRGRSEWVQLGQIAELQAGFAFPSADFSQEGDRLLRGSNVGVDRLNWEPSETRYWPSDRREEVSRFVLSPGDIVVAMDRPFITEGFKVARVSVADVPALLLQRVGRFMAAAEGIRAIVWAFVHSRSFQFQLLSQQEGTDLPHISKGQIDSTLLPRKAMERPDVSAMFGQLHDLRSLISCRVSALKAWRSALIHEVLS